METWILENETVLRISFFLGIFILVALWEIIAPRRPLNYSKPIRWYSNIGIVVINNLLIRVLFPVLATGLAAMCHEKGWGILNNQNIPLIIGFPAALLMMDGAIYIQHVLFHTLPLLSRFHGMHHTDMDLDVSSGARFHPVEIILSMLIKLSIISIIGPSVLSVIIFEIGLNMLSMFNHGNIYIPVNIDKILRYFIVTPDMHRVHHSIIKSETNTNFGFNFPWWDRLFGTYCAQPKDGHDNMTIGIPKFRNPGNLHLHKMLIQPFVKERK
jgi:sterol desaturase/sphingolipid hydroxylase (fatty acid hydroxylase superfamily)